MGKDKDRRLTERLQSGGQLTIHDLARMARAVGLIIEHRGRHTFIVDPNTNSMHGIPNGSEGNTVAKGTANEIKKMINARKPR